MNLDDMLEEASKESFWRKLIRNMWLRKSILSAVTVASVLYGTSDAWSDEFNKKSKSRDLKEASYPEAGLILWTSPNIGYWFGPFGIRLSGMYRNEEHNAAHLNLGYKLLDNKTRQHSINILIGKIVGSDPGADYDYTYIGGAYSINYRGLFLEVGVAKALLDELGNVKREPLLPLLNVGYIYRFTPKEN